MNDDIIFNENLPISIKRLKNDIKFLVPEDNNQYVPGYAEDVKENFLTPQALEAKKVATFPWNSSLTEAEPLAGNLILVKDIDTTQTFDSQTVSNVNSSDDNVLDEYVEGEL